MNRLFEPEPRAATYKGRQTWEVDCRQWSAMMDKMGHPHRRRFQRLDEAKAWCRQLVRDEATGRRPEPGPVAVRNLCAHYLRSIKKSDRTDATYKTYSSRLNRLVKFLDSEGVIDVRDLSPSVVELYRLDCYDKLTPAGALGALLVPHAMFKYANKVGFVDGNPFAGMDFPRPKQRRRAFTDDERDKLLRDGNPELLRIWRFLLLTGLRRLELTTLLVDDVVIDSPAPFLRVMGKGRKRRDVPLSPAALDIARDLVRDAVAAERERFCPYAYDALGWQWQKERKRLGLPVDLKMHSMRHSFASTLVNRTSCSLTEASRVLGHSSVVQTEVYVHRDEAQLRRGMAMLDAEFDPQENDEQRASFGT